MLAPAIKEIEENANWKIIYTDVKKGRKIVGFNLEVWSAIGYAYMERCKQEGVLPGQMDITDFPEMLPEDY